MPAPLRVKLSRLEEETLTELHRANSVPYRTRDRAHRANSVPYRTRDRAQMLKLNAQGINVRPNSPNI